MDDVRVELQAELRETMRRASELKVALDQAEGRLPKTGVPHYSLIEDAAHELGQELSRMVQERMSYVFVAAKAVHPNSPDDAWSQYLAWMRGCWQGDVDQVLEELRVWQEKLGSPPKDAPDQDPRQLLAKTITYLDHNRSRMQYDEYRRQGLPVTTAWMESLVKEMNYRVKGTEMWWNDPEGAEAILQLRAATLSEDDRLTRHLNTRPGSPFTRKPNSPKPAAKKIKS